MKTTKKTKIIVSSLVMFAVLAIAGVVSAAPTVFKKQNSIVFPKHSSVRGTVSNVSGDTFTLTTLDNKVYTVSIDAINKKQEQREAKRLALEQKRLADGRALHAEGPKHRAPKSLAPVLADGMKVAVSVLGEIVGTELSATRVHELPERKVPTSKPRS